MNTPMSISQREITPLGKWITGFFTILFLILPIAALMAYWPNSIPKGSYQAVYKHELFNICLLDADCNCMSPDAYSIGKGPDHPLSCPATINLNTILMILVSFSGFLGSMIHTSSSLVNYIGSGKFRRRWLLWYIVKPFTGAALSIVIYFILRAGILNPGESDNLNLYGLVTLAALSGLFSDKATLKLEEIFSVIFKTQDVRPDKISPKEVRLEEGEREQELR